MRASGLRDALSRILAYRGYAVTREYYINDYGSQVTKLGESVRALALVSRSRRTATTATTSRGLWRRPAPSNSTSRRSRGRPAMRAWS